MIRCANPTCAAKLVVMDQRLHNRSAAWVESVLNEAGWSMVIQDGAWVALCERCAKDEP